MLLISLFVHIFIVLGRFRAILERFFLFNTIVSRETLRFWVFFLVLFVVLSIPAPYVAFISSFVYNKLVRFVLLMRLFNAVFVLLFHVKQYVFRFIRSFNIIYARFFLLFLSFLRCFPAFNASFICFT